MCSVPISDQYLRVQCIARRTALSRPRGFTQNTRSCSESHLYHTLKRRASIILARQNPAFSRLLLVISTNLQNQTTLWHVVGCRPTDRFIQRQLPLWKTKIHCEESLSLSWPCSNELQLFDLYAQRLPIGLSQTRRCHLSIWIRRLDLICLW